MNFPVNRPLRAALLLLGVSLLTACESAKTRAIPAVRPQRHIGASDIDAREIADTANFLAGMPGRADGPYHSLEALPDWQTYRAKFDEVWARVQEHQLKPVAEFEKRALEADKESSRFVFYPFSGPDVLYLTRFFPDRAVYVMAGLERVGHLPRTGEYTAGNTPGHLNAWSKAMNSIFSRSFFVTSEMSRQLHSEDSDGLLPLIVLLLTRSGYCVDAVQLGHLANDGSWEKPIEGKRPRAVRLEFHAAEGKQQTLYYLSTDLAAGFGEHSPLEAFLDRIGRPETFMKSASFLPHLAEFKGLRNYVLRASTRIAQDDTGVPYQTLVDKGWHVRLYGEYSHPDPPFRSRFQPALEAAFADVGGVEPLGFSIGYGFHRRPSSLLVATPNR